VGPQRNYFPLIVLAFGFLATGCSKSDELASVVPVKGKIVFLGKPISAGNTRAVILTPDNSQGNTSLHEARGTIDREGNFEVTTANRNGALPGPYKVAIVLMDSPLPDSKNPYVEPKWLIDPKYGKPELSGLKLNVVENAPAGAYDLQVATK